MRWPRMPSSVFVPHRRLRPARLIAPLAAMTIGACAERPPAEDLTPIKRDSAGVEIVEMRGSPWSAPAWASVDTTKALRIVPDDSRPETLFARLRGALRLPDGRIAVLDVGRQRVQLFAADGS